MDIIDRLEELLNKYKNYELNKEAFIEKESKSFSAIEEANNKYIRSQCIVFPYHIISNIHCK
jgi:hypothetical protein